MMISEQRVYKAEQTMFRALNILAQWRLRILRKSYFSESYAFNYRFPGVMLWHGGYLIFLFFFPVFLNYLEQRDAPNACIKDKARP